MIDFDCKNCGEGMEAPESLAGESLQCPRCKLHESRRLKLMKTKNLIVIFLLVDRPTLPSLRSIDVCVETSPVQDNRLSD